MKPIEVIAEDIGKIEGHLKEINGSIVEVKLDLNTTDSIAKEARDRAIYNSTRYDKLVLGITVSSLTALVAVVVLLFQFLAGG